MYNDVLKINKEEIKDKIYACWCGKNIGGTLGAPFEFKPQLNDVKGFVTEKGKIIPNDDLDLQLAWLCALENYGPYNITSEVLGEYWLDLITPHWSEYGVCKGNMKLGLLPSISGEYNNPRWKHSNGAWIRSEIWACLAPGFPQIAIKYAYMDACVDHGMGEGTYAALFTTAMDSIAFREKDIKKIITEALTYIPEDCRIYKSVKLVMDEYEKKTDWKVVREKLMEMDDDIGTFMAPANIGYVIIGLLYGEGDFKKSLITAVNCGDDTDCTAATIGALMGIINGTKGLPDDWCEHIGDKIETISIEGSYLFIPKDLTELTDRVYYMMPVLLKANRVDVELAEECDYSVVNNYEVWCDPQNVILNRSPYTYDGVNLIGARVMVQYDSAPEIAPGETVTGKLRFVKFMSDTRYYQTRVFAPEGWEVKMPKNIMLPGGYVTHASESIRHTDFEYSVTAGENVEPITRIAVEITVNDRPNVFYVPIVLVSK